MVQGGPMCLTKSFVLLFVLSLFIFSEQAHSGVLVEPYLGYQFGSGDRNNNDYSYNSPQLGGRFGYQFLGFMGGLDYSMSSFDLETTNTVTNATSKTDYSQNQLGLFAGYNLPIMLRAWATYFISAKLEDDIAPITEYSGGGYALGVGFTGLPFISLNVEYRSMSYDEQETSGVTSAVSPSLDFSEVFFSVSLPLDL